MKGIHGEELKRIQCPCCEQYTQLVGIEDKEPYHCFEICEVCFWQYDAPAHDKLDISIGANKISLNEARENFKQYGVCKPEFKDMVRAPQPIEFPENNQ